MRSRSHRRGAIDSSGHRSAANNSASGLTIPHRVNQSIKQGNGAIIPIIFWLVMASRAKRMQECDRNWKKETEKSFWLWPLSAYLATLQWMSLSGFKIQYLYIYSSLQICKCWPELAVLFFAFIFCGCKQNNGVHFPTFVFPHCALRPFTVRFDQFSMIVA